MTLFVVVEDDDDLVVVEDDDNDDLPTCVVPTVGMQFGACLCPGTDLAL